MSSRRLPIASAEVLEQRFGLVDGYSRTLEEVGRQFRVTRETNSSDRGESAAQNAPSDAYPSARGISRSCGNLGSGPASGTTFRRAITLAKTN